MFRSFIEPRHILAVAVILAAGTLLAGPLSSAAGVEGEKVTDIFVEKLANIPGKRLTATTVDYAPGVASKPHHHSQQAELFAYVVSGAIRSKVNDEPEKVYEAGEFWYEPPGSFHSVSANASATEPARLLAVIVHDDGAELTVYEE